MKYRVRINKGNPINVARTKPVTSKTAIRKNGTNINAVRRIIAAKTQLKCKGNILFKTLPDEVTKVLSSMILTLLNIVSSIGAKISDTGNRYRLWVKYSITTFVNDIPTKNITFQKLSLFSLSLIQFFITITARLFKSIIPPVNRNFNIFRKLAVAATICFTSIVTNANDIKELISQAEKDFNIPKDLLLSIALVESRVNPYALNVGGKAVITKSAAEVKNRLQEYLRMGYANIDIGVMQINYRWHRNKFTSLDEMLDPARNIEYAARYLSELYDTHGTWIKAVRHYHSANPDYHKKYSRKIIITWLNS